MVLHNALFGGSGPGGAAFHVAPNTSATLLNNVLVAGVGGVAISLQWIVTKPAQLTLFGNDLWGAGTLISGGTQLTTVEAVNACAEPFCLAAGDNFSADPGFVDVANEDLHVGGGSPLWGAGVDPTPWFGAALTDGDGDEWPGTAGWDVGVDTE